jgi:parvulin-like peptidyl-prolyl cis-trans isomerase-like protein
MRAFLIAVVLAACSGAKGGPAMNNSMNGGNDTVPQASDVISGDILAREPVTNEAQIKHILISWNDLGGDGPKDPRAAKRTKKDAEEQVRSLVKQLQAGADFDALLTQWTEDPGKNHVYDVKPDAGLVIEFKQLGLRLKVGEFGVVQSEFGFHIMKRLQ